jgi:LytS/YehU family sensor histidine kinase
MRFLPLSEAAWNIWDRFSRTFAFATPMFLLVIKTELWTARSPSRDRIVALVLAVVAGAALYAALRTGVRVLSGNIKGTDPAIGPLWIAYCSRAILTGGLLTAILYFAVREREAALRLHRMRLARVEIERQLVESRLNLLRAQIEPHFLFNSLASVKLLYERDRRKGRELLRQLTAYLRDATSCAREREIRLGDEVALARMFLGIFEVRMGKRLVVGIDVPPELESALVPPLTVGTLVENAVKHGIGPRASGGAVRLTARSDAGYLVVGVHDDGVGFRTRSGSGVGLGNIRARLETLFGSAGSLDVATNSMGGVTATLRFPHRVAAA